MADEEKTEKATAKNETPDVPNVGSPTKVEVRGATKNAGQPLADAEASSDVDGDPQAPAPATEYTLTAVDEEDVPAPGLVTLELAAEGTFESSTGEFLRTGDRKTVNSSEAKSLLGLSVDGADAFKEV